jgi:hypothetical protein
MVLHYTLNHNIFCMSIFLIKKIVIGYILNTIIFIVFLAIKTAQKRISFSIIKNFINDKL